MNLFKKLKNISKKSKNTLFPDDIDYVVFDFETSGLDTSSCEILEVAAAAVRNDEIVATFTSLCRPLAPVDPAALRVNRLDMRELRKAPHPRDVMRHFTQLINNKTIIGYNIDTFDLLILDRYIRLYKLWDTSYQSVDLFKLVNKKIQGLANKKLTTVAEHLSIDTSNAHRALADVNITFQCYLKVSKMKDVNYAARNNNLSDESKSIRALEKKLRHILEDNIITEEEITELKIWIDNHKELANAYPYKIISETLEDVLNEKLEINALELLCNKILSGDICDKDCPLVFENSTFVLTGDFNDFSKEEVKELITKEQGIVRGSVSRKTNYLIVGSLSSPSWTNKNFGTKIKKAKELQMQGHSIVIVSEKDFINHCRNNNILK